MSGVGDGDRENAAKIFADLAIELHESTGVEETVETVVQFALQAISCTHAAVVLAAGGGRFGIAAATDPVMETICQLEIDTSHGPLIAALTAGDTVLVRDTAKETRWPEWATKVGELGLRTVLQVPLQTADRTGGVLSLCSTAADAFDADDDAVAHILARHAAVAVAAARHEETLTQAIDARKLIGQAMGILMERYDINDDRAFAILRRYSQDNNIKLRDVALQLIDTRKLPTTHPQEASGAINHADIAIGH
jgi:transcriptional regulator with GAF, ATPase, and Fis domain